MTSRSSLTRTWSKYIFSSHKLHSRFWSCCS
jgi:hypothetical protein